MSTLHVHFTALCEQKKFWFFLASFLYRSLCRPLCHYNIRPTEENHHVPGQGHFSRPKSAQKKWTLVTPNREHQGNRKPFQRIMWDRNQSSPVLHSTASYLHITDAISMTFFPIGEMIELRADSWGTLERQWVIGRTRESERDRERLESVPELLCVEWWVNARIICIYIILLQWHPLG